jgi:hypothetical protein
VRRSAPAAGLALAVAFAGGCSSGPRLHSADLALEAERPGEGRASITALALDADGERLLVGDYSGRLFDFAVADFRRNDFAEPRSEMFEGGVLALGCEAGRFVAVPRRGRGLISEAAADPAAVEKLHFPTLSGAVVTPALGLVHWSVLARTLAYFDCAGGGTTTPAVTVANVRIAAAAALADRVVDLQGRAPAPTRLEARALPSLDVLWSVDLGRSATAIAADAVAGVVVVASVAELELRALGDGALLSTLALADASPWAIGDGERILLVQGETLSVLHLHGGAGGGAARELAPVVVPAFDAHRGGVGAVAISADARWLATGGARGDLLLFRIEPLAPAGAPHP